MHSEGSYGKDLKILVLNPGGHQSRRVQSPCFSSRRRPKTSGSERISNDFNQSLDFFGKKMQLVRLWK